MNKPKYFPVLIPTLCRYEKFKTCVESLKNNLLAAETELIVGLDYPTKESHWDGYEKIRDYLINLDGFGKVTVIKRTHNYGAIKNEEDLINYALNIYDAFIFSEDDNVFSSFFLKYINDSLNYTKERDDVIAVCGYSHPVEWEINTDCLLQNEFFSAWGYGIWKNKYYYLRNEIINTSFLNVVKKNSVKLLYNNKKNYYYASRLFSQDDLCLTDIHISILMNIKNLFVVMPKISLVRNMGWDNEGINCVGKVKYDFSNQPIYDNQIIQEYTDYHGRNLELFNRNFDSNHFFLNLCKAIINFIFIKILGINLYKSFYSKTKKVYKIIRKR